MRIWGIGTDLEVEASNGSIEAGRDENLSDYLQPTDGLAVINTVQLIPRLQRKGCKEGGNTTTDQITCMHVYVAMFLQVIVWHNLHLHTMHLYCVYPVKSL